MDPVMVVVGLFALAVVAGLTWRLDDEFNGTLAAGVSLTVTTPGGGTTTVTFDQILNMDPPNREHKLAKYTPISGTKSNREQQMICSEQSAVINLDVVYEKEHSLQLDGVCGVNGCTIALNFPDGLVIAGTGGIYKSNIGRLEDSKEITETVSLALNAGWTMQNGGAASVVPTYTVAMIDGAVTIDLTACGQGGTVDLTGKAITKLVITAPETNTEPVTVEKGAANGYEVSTDFSVSLSPGTISEVIPTAAPTVASDKKTLDVSGDGTEVVTVYIEAINTGA